MAQSPAFFITDDGALEYTPAAAVTGGDVIVQGGIVGVTPTDLAANEKGSIAYEGIYDVPKTTAAWVIGLPVFWNATGDPDSGDAGSGAANQIGNGIYMGIATQAAGSGDNTGRVMLNAPYPMRPVAVTVMSAAVSARS